MRGLVKDQPLCRIVCFELCAPAVVAIQLRYVSSFVVEVKPGGNCDKFTSSELLICSIS